MSGQIIATSHDRFPPKWWFSKGNPLISGKSRLVKYYNLARYIYIYIYDLYDVYVYGMFYLVGL